MVSTVTTKGQVTIPKRIRVLLNIKPSDKVDFCVESGQVVLRPIKSLKHLRGSVPAKGTGELALERTQAKHAVANRIVEAME